MSEILGDIASAVYGWLMSFTKKVQKRFPDAYFGYSEEDHAWQIFSANHNLLISIGISKETNEFLYWCSTTSGVKNGRTSYPKDLLGMIEILEDKNAADK